MFINLLALASLSLSCSRGGECINKEYENGMFISPIGTVTEYSKLRILAAQTAVGLATFPVRAQFVGMGNTGELIYDVCSSNGIFRMSACGNYSSVGVVEAVTSITGDVSIIERSGFDAMGSVVSMVKDKADPSLRVCELDVCDKVKFGDSVEVLWPRLIDSCHITETRTGYLDDNERTIVFSVAVYSGPKSNFVSLYAVYASGGKPFGWGMIEGDTNSKQNVQQDVMLHRYGETGKYDAQVEKSNGKLLLNLSIGGKGRSFLLHD